MTLKHKQNLLSGGALLFEGGLCRLLPGQIRIQLLWSDQVLREEHLGAQEILVGQAGQAHRDRVNKDHLVTRACKLAHQVGLGMRVVIPPVFTAKADYRTIP